jgi:YebC/PmpR family DNA-binding regulatory protein
MSGHSKWSTIKHKKGANDAKRGKIFSRLSKMIAISVREGGSDDPDFNPRLRVYIDKARAANMPNENIKRAIDKGAGRVEGVNYEEITYEGFGPGKVAMMVECVTDNRNRTNSDMKVAFDKNGGVLGSSGSTAYFFTRKGEVIVQIEEGKDMEEAQLELIDTGAEDFEVKDGGELRLYCDPAKTNEVEDRAKKLGYNVKDSDVVMKPNNYVDLEGSNYDRFERFLNVIDDLDDTQRIFDNARKA